MVYGYGVDVFGCQAHHRKVQLVGYQVDQVAHKVVAVKCP